MLVKGCFHVPPCQLLVQSFSFAPVFIPFVVVPPFLFRRGAQRDTLAHSCAPRGTHWLVALVPPLYFAGIPSFYSNIFYSLTPNDDDRTLLANTSPSLTPIRLVPSSLLIFLYAVSTMADYSF